eukprot:4461786-Pleurochrysis_carterae.AAC.1
MYPPWDKVTCSSACVISTFNRSETGPSSSTFHLADKASVNCAYSESRPASECRMKRSST